jgi:hypothetical protein
MWVEARCAPHVPLLARDVRCRASSTQTERPKRQPTPITESPAAAPSRETASRASARAGARSKG